MTVGPRAFTDETHPDCAVRLLGVSLPWVRAGGRTAFGGPTMDLIELKTANDEAFLVNLDAIATAHPKQKIEGIGAPEIKAFVKFVSGDRLDIDDESYEILRSRRKGK